MFFHRKKLLGRSLKILLLTNGLILTAGAMLGPIYALFVEEIGGSLLDASYAGAIFALAAGITVLISGKYADKIRRPEFIMAIGYTMVGVGFLLLTVVQSIWALLLVQALIGFGEATYSPSFDAIYSRHLDKHNEGKQWGVWESMMYFTTFFGALAGGFITTYYNFDVLFIVMACMCLLSAIYIFFLPQKVL